MADQGHKLTDEALEALEKRLYDEYEQAAKETQEKLDKYMKKFATKDAIWKKSVEAGLKTQEEYDKWRLQAIAAGDRWEKMKERIVADQLHVNQIAREIMDNEMPSIFELNANFALYQVEHDAQIDTSLTLYNREAVGQILRDDPDLLLPPGRRVSQQIQEGKAQRWERQKIQSVMTQGILQGESIPKLASRLASAVADSDYKAAVRNARTMATNAQNAGRYDAYNRLKNKGIDLTLEWAATLDNRTRHSHRMMHGQRRDVGEPFEVDGVKIMYPAQTGTFKSVSDVPQEMIWNCFTGDNMVDVDSQIVRSYKHEYSGELVTIKTASGINFTCTPNHPILTRFGWIHAAALHKGDDLLVTSTVNNGSVRRDRDVDHVHASFEALHESLSNLGRVDQRPMTDFNFHGDVPTSDVEVVSQERLLRGCIDTGISQGFYESVLKNADPLVFSKRHLVASFRRVYISTLRFMSRSRKALSLLWRGIGHANVHGLGAVADRDVILPEYAINDLPAETIIRSQLLDGLAGRVFVDNIISVHKRSSTCHVYNLQTENGYYFVGSSINRNGGKSNGNYIIAKNCRCTILAYVKGYEHDTIKHSDKMGNMTFEEWLEAKPKSQNILHQKNLGEQIEGSYIKQYRKMSKEADEILANRKPDPFKGSDFTPAKTTEEAEKFASQFISGGYKSVVNYKGVDVEYANEFNRAFNDVLAHYDPKYKLRSIQPMNMRDKRFKGSTADAAYQWGLNDLFFNKSYFKSKKEFEKHLSQHKELMDQVLPHVDALIDRFKGQTGFAAKKQLEYAEALKASGRSNVSGADPYGTMVHEIGHYLDDMLFRKEMKARGFDLSASYASYSKNISAYAAETANEYVAESFLAYWKGERDNLDPDLIAIFEGTRK